MPAEQRMAVVQAVLERLSMDEISTLIESAQQMRQKRLENRRTQLLEKWRTEAAEAGMSLDDLLTPSRRPRRDSGGTGPSKFRGPSGETWSGRGRPPNW